MRIRLDAVLLALAAAGTLRAAETTQRFEVPLRSENRIILSEINGPVEITASSDRSIRIEFVRATQGSPLPSGTFDLERLPGEVRMRSSDFGEYSEQVRNRLRIQLPGNTSLEVTGIRGELVVDAPVEELLASDIRGSLRVDRARTVQASDIGGSASIAGAREVDLKNIRGSASIVMDDDGAVIEIDEKPSRRIGLGVGHIKIQNVDGALQITLPD